MEEILCIQFQEQIFSVNCKFICDSIQLNLAKLKLEVLQSDFKHNLKNDINTATKIVKSTSFLLQLY